MDELCTKAFWGIATPSVKTQKIRLRDSLRGRIFVFRTPQYFKYFILFDSKQTLIVDVIALHQVDKADI